MTTGIYSGSVTLNGVSLYKCSDADGCSGVIEADFSDADGQLGGLVPSSVDSNGKVNSGEL
jgi:hypothetical protein